MLGLTQLYTSLVDLVNLELTCQEYLVDLA